MSPLTAEDSAHAVETNGSFYSLHAHAPHDAVALQERLA
jgi:hypothetical protein